MLRKRDLILIPLLGAGTLLAQQAKWKAVVPAVDEQGLHAIRLSPELLGGARADLGDIRLRDSTGADVPFVLRETMRASGPERFIAYDVVRNAVLKHSTEVEIERPAGEALEELHVWIKPIDAEKRVRITGSDDRQSWYMVKDDHVALQGARGDPPHQVLQLRIPRSDYRYLRLTLNDSLTAPMKVLGVGRFVPEQAPVPVYSASIDLLFTRSDSAKQTVLRFALPYSLLVERLTIEVGDTLPFMRRVELGTWRSSTVSERKHLRRQRWLEQMGSFMIRQGDGASFSLMPARLDTFELRIENGDDRPLQIRTVNAQCQERVLLARLLAGMSYLLTAGDEQLAPPQYDMAHFADELPAPVDTLVHGAMIATAAIAPGRPAFDPAEGWIWAAIITLILGMGWMAVRMLRKH